VTTYAFEQSSLLPAVDRATVWARVVAWDGINAELAPIAMSHPAAFPTIASIPVDGRVHMISVLSLLGLPFDRHHLALVELQAERHFHEVSSNLMLCRWTHSRSLEEEDGGVRVTDRCTLEPRLALLGPVLLAVYRRIFARRHKRLQAALASPSTS
jgi:ligand-binding SRPBCC domain-containing protein